MAIKYTISQCDFEISRSNLPENCYWNISEASDYKSEICIPKFKTEDSIAFNANNRTRNCYTFEVLVSYQTKSCQALYQKCQGRCQRDLRIHCLQWVVFWAFWKIIIFINCSRMRKNMEYVIYRVGISRKWSWSIFLQLTSADRDFYIE